MSQQIMSIVSILQQILAEAGDMGDTEYMAKKAFDGKLITVTGPIDAVNDTIEHIVPSGKRFYFHSAKIVITGHTVPAVFPGTSPSNTVTQDAVEADLLIDGVVKDTTNIGINFQSNFRSSGAGAIGGYGTIGDGKFDVKGLSLVGDGIKVIEIKNVLDNGTATATIIGWEEDTLTDPTLLAQSITVEASVAGDTGDLVFLKERILSGNTFEVLGDINAVNDTIEFIVPVGKTAFLLDAKIVITTHVNPPALVTNTNVIVSDRVRADLLIDAVVKDTTNIGVVMATDAHAAASAEYVGSGIGDGTIGDGRFNVKTLSLVGDGIKVIEIKNTLDNGSAVATMSGYLVDT